MRLYGKKSRNLNRPISKKKTTTINLSVRSPLSSKRKIKNICIWAIQFYFLSQFKDKMLNSFLGWGGSLQRDPSSAYI